jgi:hypothetical protein
MHTCLFMHACMYLHTYACIYIYTHTCVYVGRHTNMYIHIFMHTRQCMNVFMYSSVLGCMHVYQVNPCVMIQTYIIHADHAYNIHACIHTHIHTCFHSSEHIHTNTCVHIYAKIRTLKGIIIETPADCGQIQRFGVCSGSDYASRTSFEHRCARVLKTNMTKTVLFDPNGICSSLNNYAFPVPTLACMFAYQCMHKRKWVCFVWYVIVFFICVCMYVHT